MLENYPEKIRISFKHFPLRRHKYSLKAALAATAAQNQHKFWEYHDLLFKNALKLNDEQFIKIAGQLGLDIPQFKKDMAGQEVPRKVVKDMDDAALAGVKGTPTIFVNGRELKKRTFDDIKKLIDQELAKKM